MMLGRMLRKWRSLCRRDLRRYPDRYPEPWATGRIPTRTRRRRRRGRGAESPRPAITLPCSHLFSPSFHTSESAAPSLNLRDRTQRETYKNKTHTHTHMGHTQNTVKNSRCKPCTAITGCSSVQMHPFGLSSAR